MQVTPYSLLAPQSPLPCVRAARLRSVSALPRATPHRACALQLAARVGRVEQPSPRRLAVHALPSDDASPAPEQPAAAAASSDDAEASKRKRAEALGKGVNLFDPAATLSRLITRRFGFVGGLAFVLALGSTEGVEIWKAVRENLDPGEAPSGEGVTYTDGLVATDLKIGTGGTPSAGDFVGVHVLVSTLASGEPESERAVLLDTRAKGRPLAFVFNKTKSARLAGVEEGLAGMKRGGVRQMDLPANQGLGVPLGGLPAGPSPFPLRVVLSLEEVTPAYYAN